MNTTLKEFCERQNIDTDNFKQTAIWDSRFINIIQTMTHEEAERRFGVKFVEKKNE